MRSGLARTLSAARAAAVAVAVLAAVALTAAPAWGDESLQATGSITFTWQGSPSHGCAAIGVCDVQGALIVEAQGAASAQHFGRQTFINLNQSSSTTRVATGSGPGASECVDAPAQPGGGTVFVTRSRGGRLIGTLQPPLSSGHCAGPLMSELSRLTLPVRRSAGKHPSYDLRTTRSFTAGPFVGTLISSVTLRPSASSGLSSSSSSSGGSTSGPPPARKVLIEHVNLRYRVTDLPQALVLSFAGESDPFCGALGSCGASGTISLAPQRLATSLTLTASRQVARAAGERQAIADLRHGRMRLLGALTAGLLASETLVRSDGSRCQDSAPSRGVLFVGGFIPSPPGRPLSLAEANGEVDSLRTHCPGPVYADVFGSSGSFLLARGPLNAAQLLRRHSVLTVRAPGGFSGLGYVGSRSGAIAFSLTLERVRAGTTEAIR